MRLHVEGLGKVGSITRNEDTDNGSIARTDYIIYDVPADATDHDISEWVHELHPGQRCQHSYDCCGGLYPHAGHWQRLEWFSGLEHQIVVRVSYTHNI